MGFVKHIERRDMLACTLCHDAPCSRACALACQKRGVKEVLPDRRLRNIWFENEESAACAFAEGNPCADCDAPCEKACVKAGQVRIKELMTRLHDEVLPDTELVETGVKGRLESDLCGIPLENPFLLSSSVVASTYDMCARAFEAGWAGAAFKTVCSMDIHEASPRFSAITGDNGTITGFKNIEQLSDHTVKENMEIFRRLKAQYPEKFILASIMGQNEEEWAELAGLCEENGADAVELNFSCPNMAESGLGADIGQTPEFVEQFTAAAKRGCHIPVLAKLTPNVASMCPAGEAARKGGADGLAAINTINSIIGVNPHTYISAPAVHGMSAVGGYSGNAVKPMALYFIAELAQNEKLKGMHLSGMGGIETWLDALEFILLGAGSVQVTTAVMQYGYRIIEDLISGMDRYLAEKGVKNIRELTGLGALSVSASTDVLERDTVIYPKFHPAKCIGCGRCVISCMDGGHQAILFSEDRRPQLDAKKCVGCHLCTLVCPMKAITSSRKRVKKEKNAVSN